uniref:Probable ADP-ribosylation factor GTPase-activating protein AGD14 isoform X1 n=1 Tax=Tanacetum cinerariifolium TaxID=118510 RepID=A0A6L2KCK0_TANCI|nr:probable ADP-ribosylation factor GTPase-activating protein AGD14 isoform X1 [Tanacetum cinerariifolium]
MTCSGIHREFTHRVKSVSMSKFTSQEVEALQEGGNQRARETFLRDWDPREQRLPDNSNVDKVRDFIKSVYVDKKFFSSKASGKPPRDTLNHRNNEDDTRRASSYHSYSQSPPYDYQYEERRYGKQAPALTKKPGSDRGMFRFLSTSRLSDHVQEDRSGTQSPPSLSQSSGSGKFDGLDLFSALNQPPSTTPASAPLSQSSGSGKFDGLDLFNVPNQPPSTTPPPAPLSQYSGSGKFDGLDLFNVPNQPPSNTPAPTPLSQSSGSRKFHGLDLFDVPNQPPSTTPASAPSAEPQKFDSLDLFNAPNQTQSTTPAPSVESGKFDGLDLFRAPYAPQSTTTTPMAINLFDLSATSSASVASTLSVNQQFKAFEPSVDLFTAMPKQQSADTLNDKSVDTVTQKNDGWASFDMPWHAEPSQDIKSSITVSETSTSDLFHGKFDQTSSPDKSSNWSFQQDFSTSGPASLMNNRWQGGVHDNGVPVNEKNNQSWSSFEESTTTFESIYTKSGEQIPIQAADQYFAWGISENVNMKQADLNTRPAPFLSTTPYALDSFDSSSELPVQHGAESHVVDTKSRNPFDFPSDTDLDPSNMFLDMSSVHSALPNHNMSTPWFSESATMPYAPGTQDALVYLAGQAPSMQIPNIQAQGPVASIDLKANHCAFDTKGVAGILNGGGLQYLKFLNFERCYFVEDDAVMTISKGCRLLHEWNLSFCYKIGVLGWESIGLYAHNLKILNVSYCDNLYSRGLTALYNGCKRLSVWGEVDMEEDFNANLFPARNSQIISREVSIVLLDPPIFLMNGTLKSFDIIRSIWETVVYICGIRQHILACGVRMDRGNTCF